MDISGLATIPATPSRPPTDARPSQHVLKRPPLEGDYITVTDSSGNRIYLRQKEDAGTKVKQLTCDFFFSPYIFVTIILMSGFMFLLFYSCLSPGGQFQNSTRLPWFPGAVSNTNRSTKGTRDTEGECQ